MKKQTLRGIMLVAALTLVVALFAASCGGSSADTTAAPSSTATTAAAGSESSASASASGSATSVDDSAKSGSIVVSGLVDYPMTFTAVDMDYMDWVTVTTDEADTGSTSYDGVHLSEIFTYVGVQSGATTMVATGSDGASAEITLADISSDALLSSADDGSLDRVLPGADAAGSVQDVVKIEFK